MITMSRMKSASPTDFRFWSYLLVALLILFVFSRLLWVLNFPIFNDEAIHTEVAQLINQNWDEYKFISLSNWQHDWKPPLHYWFGAPFVGWTSDPLLAVRLISVSVSVIGFLSIYAFSGYFFNDRRTAFWVGLLWTLNPMVLFYDRVYKEDSFVYSFSAAAILFTFLTISKNRFYIVPAVLFAASALLSKQSGMLSVVSLLFFIALQIRREETGAAGKRLKVDYSNIVFIILIAVLAVFLYRTIIPTEYFKYYHEFTGRWTSTAGELSQLPLGIWLGNLKKVYRLYSHYYTHLSLGLILFFTCLCVVRRGRPHLLILAWFIFNSSAVIFGLKQFSEYIYNTSNVFFLTLILGSSICYIQGISWRSVNRPVRLVLRYAVIVILLVSWIYPLPVFYTSAETYIERFGTRWMKQSFLYGWSSGFGVKEMVSLLEKERNKIVFVDPGWGNPATAIFVYRQRYPTLRIVQISSRAFFKNINRSEAKNVIVIFKNKKDRTWDDELLNHHLCRDKKIYKLNEEQIPLIFCRG